MKHVLTVVVVNADNLLTVFLLICIESTKSANRDKTKDNAGKVDNNTGGVCHDSDKTSPFERRVPCSTPPVVISTKLIVGQTKTTRGDVEHSRY